MLSPQAYFVVLFVVCAYAFVRGRTDERVVATTCLAASIASVLVATQKASAYSHLEAGILLVDIGAFVAFTLVALKSERFWPLWVAGLQLTSSTAHLLKAIEWDLLPRAYGAAAIFWSYPILLILAIATWRGQHQRSEAQRGAAA